MTYKFLPAYSHLNPIEEFFGELKANYRALRPLAQTEKEVKSRITTLVTSRTRDFGPGYQKAFNLLASAVAKHPLM